jgi:hypothetical protein
MGFGIPSLLSRNFRRLRDAGRKRAFEELGRRRLKFDCIRCALRTQNQLIQTTAMRLEAIHVAVLRYCDPAREMTLRLA